ncbi:MAG: sensor histidine kinase, partial [Candidatus Limnocylindria bacterium]
MTDPTSSAAFEALLGRSGADLLVVVDDLLRIVRAGPEAASLAERDEAALAGMSLIAAFGSASLDAIARRAAADGITASGEADLGRLGSRRFAIDAVPLVGGGLVISLHDITTLRRIERVRRDFVANISHELRTPLTSIKLLAETLSSGSVDDGATMRDFATQIEREADHLAQLVDELLDLSMIESGETKLALEALDPEEVVADIVARIGPVGERSEVRINRLPPSTSGARAMA